VARPEDRDGGALRRTDGPPPPPEPPAADPAEEPAERSEAPEIRPSRLNRGCAELKALAGLPRDTLPPDEPPRPVRGDRRPRPVTSSAEAVLRLEAAPVVAEVAALLRGAALPLDLDIFGLFVLAAMRRAWDMACFPLLYD